jgi:hypothetical protein
MKKMAALIIIFGSGLTAFGFSGWQAVGHPAFTIGEATGADWDFSAGWPLRSQIEITVGITLLACGLLLRKELK